MKRIPKSFQLMGHTITVRVVSQKDWEALGDKYEDLDDAVGFWIPADDLIVIKKQTPAMTYHTWCHELMHAITYYINSPLTNDEVFIDNAGGLLAQALSTAK